MANDSELLSLYTLCESRSKFVYEAVPGMFQGNSLSAEEFEYWIVYGIIQQAKYYNVQYHSLNMDEVIRLVREEERKRQKKYAKGNS
jgi:hypothetical protein